MHSIHVPMIACYDNDHGLKLEKLKYLFCMFSYISAHLCELNTNPANMFAHVMRLTYARWCACPPDYMKKRNMEYVCLCWIHWKNDNTILALNVQYILHLKKVILNNVFS